MQVTKVGDKLAVLLPEDIARSLGISEGDEVEVVRVPRVAAAEAVPDRIELLRSLRKYRGSLPAGFKFDREEANSREAGDAT